MGQSHPQSDAATHTASIPSASPSPSRSGASGAGPTTTAPDSSSAELEHSRRWARGELHAELAGVAPGTTVVAVHDYGSGCVAVGVTGPVDRAAAERLAGLLRDLRSRSTRELLLSFAGLGPCHPHLARVIGQVRIHHLIDGGEVELHDAPPALSLQLGLAGWNQPPKTTRP